MTARYVDLIGFARERYPEQFARFEAENPGLPGDLAELTALPHAPAAAGRDPIWGSLIAASLLLGLLTLFSVKVLVPRLQSTGSSADASTASALRVEDGKQSARIPAPRLPQTDTTTTTPQVQPYNSVEGRFSVLFPGAPTQDTQQVTLPDGDLMTIHQFQSAENNVAYLVLYNDYPAKYAGGDAQSLLESVRDRSIESAKATLSSDEPINLAGVPGRAVKFTGGDGITYIARYFLDGPRLYQLIVTVGAGSMAAQADDFLNSFRIL
jgi:hypothetical protein